MFNALIADGALWFSIPALLGTGYLLISLILDQTTGGDLDIDLDIEISSIGHAENPASQIRVLSMQSIAAFCVGAGWMGLTAYRLAGLGFTESAFIAVGSGIGVAWLFIAIMRWLFGLQSSGNVAIADTLYRTGSVTIVVPPANQGRGRVAIVLSKRKREFDAVQQGETPLHANATVKVVSVDHPNNTVTIEPA